MFLTPKGRKAINFIIKKLFLDAKIIFFTTLCIFFTIFKIGGSGYLTLLPCSRFLKTSSTVELQLLQTLHTRLATFLGFSSHIHQAVWGSAAECGVSLYSRLIRHGHQIFIKQALEIFCWALALVPDVLWHCVEESSSSDDKTSVSCVLDG